MAPDAAGAHNRKASICHPGEARTLCMCTRTSALQAELAACQLHAVPLRDDSMAARRALSTAGPGALRHAARSPIAPLWGSPPKVVGSSYGCTPAHQGTPEAGCMQPGLNNPDLQRWPLHSCTGRSSTHCSATRAGSAAQARCRLQGPQQRRACLLLPACPQCLVRFTICMLNQQWPAAAAWKQHVPVQSLQPLCTARTAQHGGHRVPGG